MEIILYKQIIIINSINSINNFIIIIIIIIMNFIISLKETKW